MAQAGQGESFRREFEYGSNLNRTEQHALNSSMGNNTSPVQKKTELSHLNIEHALCVLAHRLTRKMWTPMSSLRFLVKKILEKPNPDRTYAVMFRIEFPSGNTN